MPAGQGGSYLALTGWLILPIVLAVQPTVGMISDYTISRWGRRKPYIAIGATLDVLFLIGLATSQTYLSVLAFLALLQFSSNFAQGPFQGYVPDLVPRGAGRAGERAHRRDADDRLRDRQRDRRVRRGDRRLHDPVDRARAGRAGDGDRDDRLGSRGDGRKTPERPLVGVDRAVRLGPRHPARAELRLPRRSAA